MDTIDEQLPDEQDEQGMPAPNPALMAMDPDHPMLQRAQQALARQLNAKRMRVEGELRENQTALMVRLSPATAEMIQPGNVLHASALALGIDGGTPLHTPHKLDA
jgi:hypothetical protein